MARKRLMKGANALRVEERIARVPVDLAGPGEGETGIFEALKALELGSGAAVGPQRRASAASKPAAALPARPSPEPAPPSARGRAAGAAKRGAGAEPKAAARPAPESAARLGPHSFTAAERRAIVVSCTEYRNRLPTYLQSARREVEIIDSILSKCERAAEAAERGASPDPGEAPKRG